MKISCLLNISLIISLFGFEVSSAVAQTAPRISPKIPNNLQVPSNQNLILKAAASGSQIYICKAKVDNPNTFKWTLKAPEAVLFNEQGQKLGQHYAGPTWEANDGSKVIGQVHAKVDASSADAIPWLLLEVKYRESNGVFSQVNWIQRRDTVNGKAPAGGCDRTSQNREIHVPYTANYYFYGAPVVNSGDSELMIR